MDRYIEFVTNHWILFIALVAVTFFLIQDLIESALQKFESIPPALAVAQMNSADTVIIDVREVGEYVKGHIEGAINILNTELELEGLESVIPDRGTPVLFYCNGVRCLRSSDSITKTVGWGYTKVFWFRGGWKEWTEKRLPVVTD